MAFSQNMSYNWYSLDSMGQWMLSGGLWNSANEVVGRERNVKTPVIHKTYKDCKTFRNQSELPRTTTSRELIGNITNEG